MKKYSVTISLFIVSILIIFMVFHKREKYYYVDIKGKADIPVKMYDFGKITYLDTINYTFIIRNTGREMLVINKVLPNCNCTVVDYKKGRISPGHSVEIKARFIPKKTILGLNKASILIEGNFNNGVTELILKGIVTDVNRR